MNANLDRVPSLSPDHVASVSAVDWIARGGGLVLVDDLRNGLAFLQALRPAIHAAGRVREVRTLVLGTNHVISGLVLPGRRTLRMNLVPGASGDPSDFATGNPALPGQPWPDFELFEPGWRTRILVILGANLAATPVPAAIVDRLADRFDRARPFPGFVAPHLGLAPVRPGWVRAPSGLTGLDEGIYLPAMPPPLSAPVRSDDAERAAAKSHHLRFVRQAGRLVVAAPARKGDRSRRGEGEYVAAEVSSDGWIQAGEFAAPTWIPVEDLVSAFVAGGIVPLQSGPLNRTWTWRTTRERTLADWTAGGRQRTLRGLLRGRADLALVEVCGRADDPAAVHRWVRADPARATRRRQFVMGWPILCDLGLDPAIARVVDAGEPLLAPLAARSGLGVPILRRIHGLARFPIPFRGGARDPERVGLVDVLTAVGHDRLPEAGDAEGWRAFSACLESVQRGFVPCTGSGAILGRMLASMPGPDWPARAAWLVRTTGAQARAPAEIIDVTQGLARLLRLLAGEALPPIVPGQAAFGAFDAYANLLQEAQILLAGHGTYPRLLEASRRWHANPALSGRTAGVRLDATWDVPFGETDLGEGWRAVPLGSHLDLVDEGVRGPDRDGIPGMGHCIATYARRCLEQGDVVVSLRRDVDGRTVRQSTVLLVQGTDRADGYSRTLSGITLRVGEHKGPFNADPTVEAEAKLARFMILMLQRRLAPPRVREPNAEDAASEESLVGFEADLRPWRSVLPAELAALSTEALAGRLLSGICGRSEQSVEDRPDPPRP